MKGNFNKNLQTAMKNEMTDIIIKTSNEGQAFAALLNVRHILDNIYFGELTYEEKKEKDLLVIAKKALDAYVYGLTDFGDDCQHSIKRVYEEYTKANKQDKQQKVVQP